MPAPFNLLHSFIDSLTKRLVYFHMSALFILIPDQMGHTVDGRIEISLCQPEILAHLVSFLPAGQTKPKLCLSYRRHPDIRNLLRIIFCGQKRRLLLIRQHNQFRLFPLMGKKKRKRLCRIRLPHIRQNYISPAGQRRIRAGTLLIFM